MSAYKGKILWVNLSTGKFTEEELSSEFYRKYLSGMGLAARVLFDHIPPNADPLGPENVIGFVSGLLTGTPSLFTGRWMAAAKSPLTNTWGDANCGGYFSLAIKKCGYDGIFFLGTSSIPVYLFVDPSGPQLIDASDLWGKDTKETESNLKVRHGGQHNPGIVCIGLAGEKCSCIAGISHEHGRMAARSGLGAVMGSKKLKAVVLAGAQFVDVADAQKMKALNRKSAKLSQFRIPLPAWMMSILGKVLRNPWISMRMDGILYLSILKKWGTVGLNQTSVEWGDSPIKNWMGTYQDFPEKKSKNISPAIVSAWEDQKYHCLACPLGCGGLLNVNGDIPLHKPEYETTLAFSGLLLNSDWESIVKINEMLNRGGMDSISAGGTVAAAIEWYEQGYINKKVTDDLELSWGNSQAIIELVKKMINREGFGDALADGSKRAAQRLNIKDQKGAVTAGGAELAMHDPRLDPGFGLHASVEPAPGRHTSGAFIYYDMYRLWTKLDGLPKPYLLYGKKKAFQASEKQGKKSVAMSNFTNFYNALGVCLFGTFLGVDRLPLFELVNAATGWEMMPEEYMEIGRRIQTIRQMFNVKHGIKPKEIQVSSRALGLPPLKLGPNKGSQIDLDAMRCAYWSEMGWNSENGIPTNDTLMDLEIVDLIQGEGA
jgi:aldehyde:ferredoxin oxidoreductase